MFAVNDDCSVVILHKCMQPIQRMAAAKVACIYSSGSNAFVSRPPAIKLDQLHNHLWDQHQDAPGLLKSF